MFPDVLKTNSAAFVYEPMSVTSQKAPENGEIQELVSELVYF